MSSTKEIDVRVTANTSGLEKGMDKAASTVSAKSNLINDILKRNAEEAVAIARKQTQDAVTAAQKQANEVIAAARKQSQEVARANKEMAGSSETAIGRVTASIKGMVAAYFGIQAVIGIARSAAATASNFEQLSIQLNAVMGSAEKGEQAFSWIKQFAVDTPYSVQQTTQAFMQLKNFGLDPMDGTLRKIADASAKYGSGMDTANRVTLALGQAWARGKLQGQDTLQMIDAGIPVYDLLASVTGKTAGEIQKMSEKGELGRDVMRKLIDEMGRVSEGTAEAKMNTMAGAVSNMGDAFANAIDDVRQEGGFDFITESMKGMTQVIPTVVSLFAEVGYTIGNVLRAVKEVVTDVFSVIIDSVNSAFGRDSEPMSGMEFFTNMLKVVQVAVIAFGTGFKTVFSSLKTVVLEANSVLNTFWKVAANVMSFNFSGANASYKNGINELKNIAAKGTEDLINIANKGAAAMNTAIMGKPGKAKIAGTQQAPLPPGAPSSGAGAKGGKGKKSDGPTDVFDNGSFITSDKGTAEFIKQQYDAVNDLQREMVKEAEKAEKAIEDARKKSSQQQIAIKNLWAKDAAAAEIAVVDAAQSAAQQQYDLGIINYQQLLAQEAEFESQRTNIRIQALNDRLLQLQAVPDKDRDPEAIAQAQIAIEELERQHQARMGEIRGQAVLEQKAPMMAIMQSVEQGMSQLAGTMLTNWRNVGTALRSVLANIGQTIIHETIIKPQIAKITAWAKEKGLTLASIGAKAADAGAGAASSQASIPIIGPVLAVAAMAAIFAAVSGMSSKVPSAAGGFDIPSGMNPLTQLHEEEMVLPKNLANNVRKMTGEGTGTQQVVNNNVTMNIQTQDADSFRASEDQIGADMHARIAALSRGV